MKARFLSALLLFAIGGPIATCTQSAPAPEPPPHAFLVKRITTNGWPIVMPDTPMAEVLRRMGRPAQTLTPNHWIYRTCRPVLPRTSDHNCRILLLEFRDDRVFSMKFVNPRALTVISTCLNAGHTVNYLAAK